MPIFVVIFGMIRNIFGDIVSTIRKNPILLYIMIAVFGAVIIYNRGYNSAKVTYEAKIVEVTKQAEMAAAKQDEEMQANVTTMTALATAKDKEIMTKQTEAISRYEAYLQKLKNTPIKMLSKTKDAKGKDHDIKITGSCPVDDELLNAIRMQ